MQMSRPRACSADSSDAQGSQPALQLPPQTSGQQLQALRRLQLQECCPSLPEPCSSKCSYSAPPQEPWQTTETNLCRHMARIQQQQQRRRLEEV
jgi:hypothetical protein